MNYRSQGGTLDLRTNSGLAAIKEAGLWDEFQKHGRYDGQYMAIVDKSLGYHFVRPPSFGGPGGESPEIDRHKLREILVDSLPEGIIHWGHRLKKVEDGNTLVFENTTKGGYHIIVGADGAWSKVRNHVAPDLKPVYTGVAGFDMSIPDAENTAPETYKIVNRGSVFACGEGQRFTIQQMGDGSLHVYPSFVREDPDWMLREKCGYDSHNIAEAKAALAKEFSDWCPELRDAISAAQGSCVPRSLYILPVGTRWDHKPGFTLIGDAAHLMSPHAGEGVNQALEDAMLLARAITGALGNDKILDDEITAFEIKMFGRAKKVQKLSYDLCQDWMFTPGSPKSVMPRAISRHLNSALPWVLHPLGTAGVYSFYFFKNMFS